jgi:predicted outer membrane repeat protein
MYFMRRCSIILACFFGASAYAATYYVDTSATGANDGSSWNNALVHLSGALTNALSGDEIWIAGGVYRPTGEVVPSPSTASRQISFEIPNGVAVYGGFAGIETLRDQRDPSSNLTVLSGDIDANDSQQPVVTNTATATSTSKNSLHVLYFSGGETDSILLDGVTVTAGRVNDSDANTPGAGMLFEGGFHSFNNVNFEGNYNYYDGGGIAIKTAQIDFNGCDLKNNRTFQNGGGAHIDDDSNVTFSGGLVSNNYAANINHGGGAFYVRGSLHLKDCEVIRNTAYQSAAGAVHVLGSLFAEDCVFRFNKSIPPYGGGVGGAVRQDDSSSGMGFVDCIFEENEGSAGGALAINKDAFISGCHFVSNSCSQGGAINSHSDNLSIVKSTFRDNSGDYGGAISGYYSDMNISDCLFVGNSSEESGGAIYSGYGGSNFISRCDFISNNARDGGALSGYLFFIDLCTFSSNSALDEYVASGGALYGSGSISNSLFLHNFASSWGGAVFNTNLKVVNSSFVGNRSDYNGGAFYATGNLFLDNCTMFGNEAKNAGGAIFNTRDLSMSHCSLTENIADYDGEGGGTGGGIFCEDVGSHDPILIVNSVIARNYVNFSSSHSLSDMYVEDKSEFTDVGHNLFGVNPSITLAPTTLYGNSSSPLDPMLETLAFNGGPTPTCVPMVGSPVTDAGTLTIPFDQRGYARPEGAAADIGAVEFLTPEREAEASCSTDVLGPRNTEDPDRDGVDSAVEWHFGRNPLIAETSRLIECNMLPNSISIPITTSRSRYSILGASDLIYPEWDTLMEFDGTNAVVELDTSLLPYRFYRIDVSIR